MDPGQAKATQALLAGDEFPGRGGGRKWLGLFGVRFEAGIRRDEMTRTWAGSRPQNGRLEDLDSVLRTIRLKLENEISIFSGRSI